MRKAFGFLSNVTIDNNFGKYEVILKFLLEIDLDYAIAHASRPTLGRDACNGVMSTYDKNGFQK